MVETSIETALGTLRIVLLEHKGQQVVCICSPRKTVKPIVRIHSACMFGEILHSEMCECGQQLQGALKMIHTEGGCIIYLAQEGRGAGLSDKIVAMCLEGRGRTTAEAFNEIGHASDIRDYEIAVFAMKHLSIGPEIRLITNNPNKIQAVEHADFRVIERLEIPLLVTADQAMRIRSKQKTLGHIPFSHISILGHES